MGHGSLPPSRLQCRWFCNVGCLATQTRQWDRRTCARTKNPESDAKWYTASTVCFSLLFSWVLSPFRLSVLAEQQALQHVVQTCLYFSETIYASKAVSCVFKKMFFSYAPPCFCSCVFVFVLSLFGLLVCWFVGLLFCWFQCTFVFQRRPVCCRTCSSSNDTHPCTVLGG